MIGNLPEKDLSFLEERIKRSQLSRPPPGSTGPLVAAAAPVAAAPPPQPVQPAIPEPRSGIPGIPGNRNRNIPPPGSGLPSLKRYQAHQQQSQLQQMQQQQAQSDIPSNIRRSPPSGSGLFGRDRPVSGVFSLDLDKIENGGELHRSNGSGPKLVSHNLDDIFGDDGHVRLPPTISSARTNHIGGGQHYAPPAMSMQMQPHRNLIESPEAYEALDIVIAQVRQFLCK